MKAKFLPRTSEANGLNSSEWTGTTVGLSKTLKMFKISNQLIHMWLFIFENDLFEVQKRLMQLYVIAIKQLSFKHEKSHVKKLNSFQHLGTYINDVRGFQNLTFFSYLQKCQLKFGCKVDIKKYTMSTHWESSFLKKNILIKKL